MGYFDFYSDTFTDQQIDELHGIMAIHEAAGMPPFQAAKQALRDKIEDSQDAIAEVRRLVFESISKKDIDAEWLRDGDTLKPVDGAILEAAAAVNGFMKSPTGNLDFGYITQEIAVAIKREAAPIRLRMGNATEGLLHIELRHSKDIAALGYKNAIEFVYAITRHFDTIYPLSKPGRGLTLVVTSGKLKYATIQLEAENGGAFYDIKNATPGRGDQFKNKNPLWSSTGPSATVDVSQPSLNSLESKTGLDLDDSTLPLTPDAVKPVLEGAKTGNPMLKP